MAELRSDHRCERSPKLAGSTVHHVCDLDVDVVTHAGCGSLAPTHVNPGRAELIFVGDGALGICVGDWSFTAHAGQGVMVAPDIAHTLFSPPGIPCAYRSIRAPTGASAASAALPAAPISIVEPSRSIASAVDRAFAVLPDCAASADARKASITRLLHDFASAARSCKCGVRHLEPPCHLARARDYLREHFASRVSLHQLGTLCRMSPPYVARTFRQCFGIPPHTYQTQLRVDRARTMLCVCPRIAAVADIVGFADQSHLTRNFMRLVGVTPARYSHLCRRVRVSLAPAAATARRRSSEFGRGY